MSSQECWNSGVAIKDINGKPSPLTPVQSGPIGTLRGSELPSHRVVCTRLRRYLPVLKREAERDNWFRRRPLIESEFLPTGGGEKPLCLTAAFDRRRFRTSLAVAVLATPSRRPT